MVVARRIDHSLRSVVEFACFTSRLDHVCVCVVCVLCVRACAYVYAIVCASVVYGCASDYVVLCACAPVRLCTVACVNPHTHAQLTCMQPSYHRICTSSLRQRYWLTWDWLIHRLGSTILRRIRFNLALGHVHKTDLKSARWSDFFSDKYHLPGERLRIFLFELGRWTFAFPDAFQWFTKIKWSFEELLTGTSVRSPLVWLYNLSIGLLHTRYSSSVSETRMRRWT